MGQHGSVVSVDAALDPTCSEKKLFDMTCCFHSSRNSKLHRDDRHRHIDCIMNAACTTFSKDIKE